MKRQPFYKIENKDIGYALRPEPLKGLIKRDVQPSQRISTGVAEGSQFRKTVSAEYDANNVDAWEIEVDFGVNLGRFPAALVWYIGAVDALGAVVGDRSVLVPGPNTSGTGIVGIYSSTAYAYAEEDKVIIGGTSIDTGHAPLVTAHFYVVVLADDPGSVIQGIV